MKRFKDFLKGLRDHYELNEIIKHVKSSKNYDKSNSESLNNAKALLLHVTQNQRSWLVKTNKRLYKILDDIRDEKPQINWSKKISEIYSDGEAKFVISSHSEKNGKIVFHHKPEKKYLYSKILFMNLSIEDALTNLFE